MIRLFPSIRIGLRRLAYLSFLTASCVGFLQCQPKPATTETATSTTPTPSDTSSIAYAKGLRISYHDHYKLVEIISQNTERNDTLRYLLLSRGTTAPAKLAALPTIEIPVRSLVVLSSTHIGTLSFLDAEDRIVGLGDTKYVYAPKVLDRIKQGKIKALGTEQKLNEEQVIALQPDLVVGQSGLQHTPYATIQKAGIPVLSDGEWLEKTPLGRAEWVKLFAALLNLESVANERFSHVENEYRRLQKLVAGVSKKPSILTGTAFKDVWYVPNGNSYMGAFFRDAGGSYAWDSSRTEGSLPLSFEAVYPIGIQADFWLNVGIQGEASKKHVLELDHRYAEFKPFKSGQLYDYSKRTNAAGTNDFWESGTVNPHLILADLIRILHPELLPDHTLYYYQVLR